MVEVRGEGMGRVEGVDDLRHLAIDRDLPAATGDDVGDVALELLAMLDREVWRELFRMQHVRDQRAHDGAVPKLHPLFGQVLLAEALAELDDVAGRRKVLLDDVGIDGFILRCGGPESSQVNGLARTLGSHDHAPRQIVRADPKTTRDGEIFGNDEVVHDLMDIGARTVRVTERSMCEWGGHSASVNTKSVWLVIDVSFAEDRIRPRHSILIALPPVGRNQS